jgi:hypothetical protein
MAKQPRSKTTTEEIITATAKFLKENEEADLSVSTLCELADVNPATIYYHFGSIENLLETTYEKMYTKCLDEEINQFREIVRHASDSTKMKSVFVERFSSMLHDKKFESNRFCQLRISATALSRPSLRAKLDQIDVAHRNTFFELMDVLKNHEIVRQDLSTQQIAYLYSSVFLSRPIFDEYPEGTIANDTKNIFLDLILQ